MPRGHTSNLLLPTVDRSYVPEDDISLFFSFCLTKLISHFGCHAFRMRSGHFVKWSTPSIGFLKDRPRIRLGLLSDEAVLGCVSSRVVSRNLPDASSRTHLFVYPEGYTGARLQCIKPCKVSLAFRKRPHNMRASLGSSMMHKAELSNDKQKIGNSQPNS